MPEIMSKSKRSITENVIADAVAGLVGSEALRDTKAITGAVIALRQIVISLEKRGFALKGETERCFEIIGMLEREGP